MPTENVWSLEQALGAAESFERLGAEQEVQRAYTASIKAGYRAGAPSGNPVGYLIDFYTNVLVPLGLNNPVVFAETVRSTARKLDETRKRMKAEGYSGSFSQKIYVGAVVADALVKLVSDGAAFSWTSLSVADWLALGVGFSMWLNTQTHYPDLRNPIDAIRSS